MGKHNLFLIKFMEGKAKKIEEHTGLDYYFNKKDAKAINRWSEKEAKQIWGKLKKTIFEAYGVGFYGTTCPFCYKYMGEDHPRCSRCSYAKHGHKVCGGFHYNDWSSIRMELQEADSPAFTNKFYKNLIMRIEREG